MGKFLRDPRTGDPVAIDGGLVLEKTLDRKPRDCEQCGYNKWVKNDKIFMVQKSKGGEEGIDANNDNDNSGGAGGGGGMQVMQWICPDCALKRGLHPQFYHKNFYSDATSPETLKLLKQRAAAAEGSGGDDNIAKSGSCSGFWDSWTSLFTACHS
eukprot:CAMPEP_0113474130 /NCGR_PEP_ID=MMETSP0014_2-20120614/18417_1 /TAXON_ID=2857 /ORGANISM="Nitzschia sp." /LENGTH=154 /DNA_ID=CAMNT_0000366951 /DNA_START=282 /DNA_END=746 /DNA_ORIENTATION=+ /assembly_acc=CAM_ASM_000159